MVGTRKSLPSLALPSDIPPELRIDGKATLLGEKRDDAPKKVYYWKGAVYEATADTPEEWLTQEPERKKRKQTPPPEKEKTMTTTATKKTLKRKSMSALDDITREQTEDDARTAVKKARKSLTHVYEPQPSTSTRNQSTKGKGKGKAWRKSSQLPHEEDEGAEFGISMPGAEELKAEIERQRHEAREKEWQVQPLRDDQVRDVDEIAVASAKQARQEKAHDDTDEDTTVVGARLLQNIYAMGKLNSRIDVLKAKFGKMKECGLSVDVLKKRKRSIEEVGDEDTVAGSSEKRARREASEDENDDTTHHDEPFQIPTPDATDQDAFMAQLQAAANAAPEDVRDRQTRSQLDAQLRSPSPDLDITPKPGPSRLTPTGEIDTSSSERRYRRHASSVSMSISPGTSPSIHESAAAAAAAAAPATKTTTRSSRPNNHFGKQQPRVAGPTLAATNRGGQKLRWSIKADDITNDPDRAESLIQKSRMEGESKSARRRRVAREKALLNSLPTQEV